MKQTLSDLHPNPGWGDTQATEADTAAPTSATDMVGKHCILELYDCDKNRLDDEAFLRDTITIAASRAGATLLNLITHRFEPQGVTGLALLAESHISIHTWPENGYAAVECSPAATTPCLKKPAGSWGKNFELAGIPSRASLGKHPQRLEQR